MLIELSGQQAASQQIVRPLSNFHKMVSSFFMKVYSHPSLHQVELVTVMQALSDPCRIAIIRALADGQELACNEFALDLSKATRSHHFEVLREAGLTFTRTEGTKCMTSLRRAELDKRFPGLLRLIAKV
jgi:DNA-binding transcriptional ArsR family regulator